VTLAVLPFDNLNRDQEYEYFADGVTDALITELGQIGSLRVISRQSVLHLKGCDRHLKDITRELNVDVFVEGATLRERDRIRISSQLIRAEPEEHLWAHSYECDITDLLAVQGKLVRAIATAVKAAVTPAELSRLKRKRIAKPDAHEAYLKARFHWSKWSEEGFRKGLEYFQVAIDRDPTYAPPLAGMANCIALLGFWGHLPIRQAYPKAKMAALRAVELDDNLSEAHAALSWIQWLHDRDLPGAEREAKRAMELNPRTGDFLWQARAQARSSVALFQYLYGMDPPLCGRVRPRN
jgi:TolB-like protein